MKYSKVFNLWKQIAYSDCLNKFLFVATKLDVRKS